jgi:peptidoglycan glycosyltransferase
MVTLATAFENDAADENTVYDSPGEMEIGGGTVTNFNNNSLGNITLETATVYSSNTAFAQLGVEMGAEMLVEGAKKFGFNDRLSFDLPLAQSIMADPKDMSEWETAWAAAGQPVGDEEDTGPRATVLQMALVGCAMANDGTIMTPYLVDGVYNANGQRSFTATQKPYLQAISKKTAERVTAILEEVVSSGTGVLAQIDGVSVAGKTGTAETGKPNDDSWFVGYAPADNPQVVVAIVLEEAIDSEYSDNAALKSQNVLQTALQIKGIL